MTGPEHYREAERILALHYPDGEAALYVAEAQAHATLALAAAMAEPVVQKYDGPDDKTIARAWSEAIS